MTGDEVLDSMAYVDADLIEAAGALPQRKRRRAAMTGWCAAAACAALLLVTGVHAYAAEQREYRAAVTFFEENDLPMDGLTRGQIKAVYRDITTRRFTCTQTAQVLQQSLKEQIPGYEIGPEPISPEEVEKLWGYRNGYPCFQDLTTQDPGDCEIRIVEQTEQERDVFWKSVISRYEDGKQLWSIDLQDLVVMDYQVLSDGILLWGDDPSRKGQPGLAKLSSDGKLLWQQFPDSGYSDETIEAVVENPDGTLAVFSRGDLSELCLRQLGPEGRCRSVVSHPVGCYGIWNAARLGEDYIVQLGNVTMGSKEMLVRIDAKGQMTDSFRYEGEDTEYCMTDMQEFDGKLYISAYEIPKYDTSGAELMSLYDQFDIEQLMQMPTEELTRLVRSQYSAVLLICDPQSGSAREFYSVRGGLGAELELDGEERLLWQVENIEDVFFSPATSAFQFGGTCSVSRYTFTRDAVLHSREDTGRTVSFMK